MRRAARLMWDGHPACHFIIRYTGKMPVPRPLHAPLIALAVLLSSSADAPAQQETELRVAPPEPVLIDDVDQAKIAMHPARFYLEPSTVLIATFDLEAIEPAAIAGWLARQQNVSADKLQQSPPAQMVDQILQSLRDAGARHVYLTLATRSLVDRGPLVIVPCDDPGQVQQTIQPLLASVSESMRWGVRAAEDAVLAGSLAAIERVRDSTAIHRPELLQQLASADQLDHHAAFSLPSEARQDLVALWPDRAPKLSPVEFSPRQLAADLQSVTLSWRLPPEPNVIATVEASDAAAGERLKELIGKVLKLAPALGETVLISDGAERFTLETTPETIAMLSGLVVVPYRAEAQRMELSNQMKQLGLAIHNYHSQHEHAPPRCFTDREGNPLLSGRVAMLPFLEQQPLYEKFQLGQAWDSAANKKLLAEMPEVLSSGDAASAEHKTRMRFPSSPGSFWHGDGPPRTLRDITDGTSSTIAMIHAPADAAVEWTNPAEWTIDAEDPVGDVFGDRDEVVILMFDGAVRTFTREQLPNETLKAMLTFAGGEVVND